MSAITLMPTVVPNIVPIKGVQYVTYFWMGYEAVCFYEIRWIA